MQSQTVKIQNQTFVLHYSGAIFWKERSILLISDVHLGKVAHFRKYGAAIPAQATLENFSHLDEVLAFFKPEQLFFLGDLFHSYLNKEWHLFESWVIRNALPMTLIAGNHDIISPLKFEQLNIKVVHEVCLEGFLLTHHPEERSGFFNFSGHIHPAIRLKGKGKQSLRLACFFKREHQLILPAFGAFTGSHVLKPKRTDQIYAITKNEVILVSA